MVYITHQNPTTQATDTPIGKIMGYLAELDFYFEHEQQCGQIDLLIPDWFPLNVLQDVFINIHKAVYSAGFQKVYNMATGKGNEVNGQIMGWVEQAKTDLTSKVNSAKAELNSLISSVTTEVNKAKAQLSSIVSQISSLNVDLSGLKTQFSTVSTKIQTLNQDVASVEQSLTNIKSTLTSQQSWINDLKTRVAKLEGQATGQVVETKKGILESIFGGW